MSRTWPVPVEGNTFHVFGDVHVGGITQDRMDAITWDLNNGDVPSVTHHLTIGDLTSSGTSGQDASFLAWMAGIPGAKVYCIGNHDVNNNSNTRTPAQWATAYGVAAQNYTVDLPMGLRVVVCGFDSMADGAGVIRLSDTTMTWLGTTLTAAGSMPCVIVCHASPWGTVGQPPAGVPAASDCITSGSGWYVIPGSTAALDGTATGLTTLIAAHTNVVGWFGGHTHSPIESANIVTSMTIGGRQVASINCSSVYYTSLTPATGDRCISPYVTWLGDRFEVRWRDHYRGQWVAPWNSPSGKVMTAMVG